MEYQEAVLDSAQDIVVSGCSGGGKSTLLAELARRGFVTVAEPGRRIVQEQLRGDGAALPWVDLAAFASLAIEYAAQDRESTSGEGGWRFFDRGLVDAAVALEHATGKSAKVSLARYAPYHRRVFLTPPWPEIYVNDSERPHPLDEAIREYERLLSAFGNLGYEPVFLPKVTVSERADFVIAMLE